MPSTLTGYKRNLQLTQRKTFRSPVCSCFACSDTGILHNSDRLINEHFSDYCVQTINGQQQYVDGSDAALICQCDAAAPYRSQVGYGTREVETFGSPSRIGIMAPAELIADLHQQRSQAWAQTVADFHAARATGELPWYVSEVSHAVQELSISKLARRKAAAIQPATKQPVTIDTTAAEVA